MKELNANSLFLIKKSKLYTKWTTEEDKVLMASLTDLKIRNKWKAISKLLNKKVYDCINRYKIINPTIKKGHWTNEEDKQVADLVQNHGKNWALIASLVKYRTGKQIRQRYLNFLDPKINKEKFQIDEDMKIYKLFKVLKTNWRYYVKYLPDRTADMIKGRYYSSIRFKENFLKIVDGISEGKSINNNAEENLNSTVEHHIEEPLKSQNIKDDVNIHNNFETIIKSQKTNKKNFDFKNIENSENENINKNNLVIKNIKNNKKIKNIKSTKKENNNSNVILNNNNIKSEKKSKKQSEFKKSVDSLATQDRINNTSSIYNHMNNKSKNVQNEGNNINNENNNYNNDNICFINSESENTNPNEEILITMYIDEKYSPISIADTKALQLSKTGLHVCDTHNSTHSCIDSNDLFLNSEEDQEIDCDNAFATNFNNYNNNNNTIPTCRDHSCSDNQEYESKFKFEDDYFLEGNMNYDNFMRVGKSFDLVFN